jgi:ribosomal protein L24E
MSQLLEFYEKLLKFCGLEVDPGTGKIYDNSTSKKVYILLDDKEMILPTYENLRDPNIKNKAVFHPIP